MQSFNCASFFYFFDGGKTSCYAQWPVPEEIGQPIFGVVQKPHFSPVDLRVETKPVSMAIFEKPVMGQPEDNKADRGCNISTNLTEKALVTAKFH